MQLYRKPSSTQVVDQNGNPQSFTGDLGSLPILPQATAPTNPSQITPGIGPLQMPQVSPYFGNTSNASSSTAGTSTYIDNYQKYIQDQMAQQQKDLQTAQSSQDTNKSWLQTFLSGQPSQSQQRSDAFKSIGIDPSQYFADEKARIAEIDKLNQEYNSYKSQRDQQIAALQGQGRGIPLDLLNNQAARIERNAAPRLAEMSANINSKAAVLQALQGNFNEAQSFVNQAIQDATANTKFKLDSFQMMYNMNQDVINRLDSNYKNAFNQAISLAKEQYDNQRADKTAIGKLIMENPKAGIDIYKDSLDEAYAKFQSAGGSLMTQAQIRNIESQINDRSVGSGTGGSSTARYNGEFGATIDLASQQGTTNQQRIQIANNLKSFIANGDYQSAYTQIVNATQQGLKGTAGTDFTNRNTQLSVTKDLTNAINQYAQAGGDTNIFKGTADKIQTRIGRLYTDPKYATLATQLDLAFQAYRQQMTGAAFGAQESRQYASVLPSKNNTLDLNLAKISGLSNYLESVVNGYIKQVVGQGGIYIGEYANQKPAQQAGFSTVAPDGKTYTFPNQDALNQFLSAIKPN